MNRGSLKVNINETPHIADSKTHKNTYPPYMAVNGSSS
jgi:hypothetical protein